MRARYKKGQKCLHFQALQQDDGEDKIIFRPATITKAEKRINPETRQGVYFYWIQYMEDNSYAEIEEKELTKYNEALISGKESDVADDLRQVAQDVVEEKRRKERINEIPSQLRIRVPPVLKKIVLDDHDLITEQGKILPLPRPTHSRPSVAEIIEGWKTFRQLDEDEVICAQTEEIAAGLLSYFDSALRYCLLYPHEVAACDAALQLGAGGIAPSEVYGSEHLARLIVKLPELISVVLMVGSGDAQKVITLEDEVEDFLAYMTAEEETRNRLFSAVHEYVENPDWVPTPPPPPPQIAQSHAVAVERNTTPTAKAIKKETGGVATAAPGEVALQE